MVSFTGELYHTFKELTPILHNLFQKREEEETLHNSFYEDSITLISKSDKDNIRKENYKLINPHEQGCKHSKL